MAEAILSTVAKSIIGKLGEAAVKELALLWGIEDELQQLEKTISTIKSVLVDAERKQVQHHNEQIKDWLSKLEDVVCDAEDLVDMFSTEALQLKVVGRNQKMAAKVRTFLSSPSHLAFRHKMGSQIKDIRKTLDDIAKNRDQFHLNVDVEENIVAWEEHSFEREENIIGRDDEKNEIIRHLMETERNMVVVPIVGVGGLGKTSLAKLVCNDAQVKEHFDLVQWVNVPKVFDRKSIIKQIVESGGKKEGSSENVSMDQLQNHLREKIKGKRYLIVLDDVWDIELDHQRWLTLEELLRDGADGSRIIVTTRSKDVACIINGPEGTFHSLKHLSEEKSWTLFKRMAFGRGQEPKDSDLVEIGKEITKSCGGIPLVIRTIGSMLFSLDKTEWFSFKEQKLLGKFEYEKHIIARLKLSYDHLPSHLKHCFAYCSLFPKNHIIDVKDLINLWMAQGFIPLSNHHHEYPEDIGYQYFKVLLYRSFFEIVEIDDYSKDITECKMHDCMHDLAELVAGTKYVVLNGGDDNKINSNTRHVSFNYDVRPQPTLLVKAKKIRTILLPSNTIWKYFLSRNGIFDTSISNIDSGFEVLRILELYSQNMEILPDFIGKMKLLRYLNLSYNKELRALPNCITNLYNLQTLLLVGCSSLCTLPGDFAKLVNLRHLDMEGCDNLDHVPRGLSQMTSLQTLTYFPLKEKPEDSAQLKELENLNNLRGHLEIVAGQDVTESRGANLKSKQYLLSLGLRIQGRMVDECEDLVPHPNLKRLKLKGPHLSGVLLNCVPSLHNLVEFRLGGHRECRYVGALHHLPNLKVLHLNHLGNVEYICSDGDSDIDVALTSPFFPSLKKLSLYNLPKLKGWWKEDDDVDVVRSTENKTKKLPFFPCLCQLWIRRCPNLISMPLFPTLQPMLTLGSTSIKPLEETLKIESFSSVAAGCSTSSSSIPLSKLRALTIANCSDLQRLAAGLKALTSLEQLTIISCSESQTLCSCLHHLTALQRLKIDGDGLDIEISNCIIDKIHWEGLASLSRLSLRNLKGLVSLPLGLQHVTTLQEIEITSYDMLESIPESFSNLKLLKQLSLVHCSNLISLPRGMDSLASLEKLEIEDCPMLLARCREGGDYWPLISKIKELVLKQKDNSALIGGPVYSGSASNQEQHEESIFSEIIRHFNCAEINRKFWLLISTLCSPQDPNVPQVQLN